MEGLEAYKYSFAKCVVTAISKVQLVEPKGDIATELKPWHFLVDPYKADISELNAAVQQVVKPGVMRKVAHTTIGEFLISRAKDIASTRAEEDKALRRLTVIKVQVESCPIASTLKSKLVGQGFTAANWSIALRSHREAEQEVKKVVAVCEFGQLQKQAAYNEIINNLSMGEDAIREASNKRSKYGRVCLNRKYK